MYMIKWVALEVVGSAGRGGLNCSYFEYLFATSLSVIVCGMLLSKLQLIESYLCLPIQAITILRNVANRVLWESDWYIV